MTINIYGQPTQHDDVLIVGTRDSLRRLAGALMGVVLSPGGGARDHVAVQDYASDGEGFNLHVVAVPDADNLPVPYSDLCSAASPAEMSELWQMVLALGG